MSCFLRGLALSAVLISVSDRALAGNGLPQQSYDPGASFDAGTGVERGAKDGMHYAIDHSAGRAFFFDGPADSPTAGLLGGKAWVVTCKTDPITDAGFCTIIRNPIYVIAFHSGAAAIGAKKGQLYPGESIMLRVDKNPHYSSARQNTISGDDARQIMQEMLTGSTITSQFVQWPNGNVVTEEVSARGFREAYGYTTWVMSQD